MRRVIPLAEQVLLPHIWHINIQGQPIKMFKQLYKYRNTSQIQVANLNLALWFQLLGLHQYKD